MRDVELLTDLARTFAERIRDEVAALTDEELAWQPAPRANTIGVTVWHCARSQDFGHLGEIQALKALRR